MFYGTLNGQYIVREIESLCQGGDLTKRVFGRPWPGRGTGTGLDGEGAVEGKGGGCRGARMSPVLPKTGEGGCCLQHSSRRGHLPTRF